ncbi:MAG TPA: metallophosphoesterase, partial [Planctomycetaceae bacterium]
PKQPGCEWQPGCCRLEAPMNWLNAAILFLLFAGHCELMAAWVNRVHALPYRRRTLEWTRYVHDLLVVGFLPFVVWRVGLTGPRLLLDGEWSQLSWGWRIYFVLCGLGVVSLAATAVRETLRRRPEVRSSKTIDVAEELGSAPAGPGFRGRIARLPGNEVFLLEVNEKEYVLPQLPAELDGLSVAHFSDTHFRGPIGLDYFRYAFGEIAALKADLIAFTGDLLDEQELVSWLPETFGRLSAPLGCWFILGNHDWLLDPEPMRAALTRLGWNDLGGTVALLDPKGRRIALGGDETPWIGEPPDFAGTESARLRVLLSHTPDNLRRASRQGIDLMLSGHNHGGQVCLPLIGPVYSPSRYGVRYAAGTFREGPTVLHVSRGLSAERPLRWNCPPEVTKVILRSPAASGRM